MKRFKIISLIMLVIMLFTIPNVILANDDFCPETEDGWHDYTFSKSMTTRHPHKGYRACWCGDKIYLEYQYSDECKTCQKELCKEGVHYYLHDIQYSDEYGYDGYGKCFCGKKKSFSFNSDRIEDEPNEGYITFFGRLHAAKHPHYEYDMDRDKYYYDSTIHTDSCGVCKLETQYYDDVEEYELDTFIYGDSYDNSYYYEDEGYDDFEERDGYDEYNYHDEDYYSKEDEYYYSDDEEDEELYEWLRLVKEILKNE